MPSPPDNFTRSTFSYSGASGYRAKNGRFASRSAVRAELDSVLDGMGDEMATLAQRLRDGAITKARFDSEMMRRIKQTHLLSAASFKGGWDNLTQADYGRVGQIVRREYEYFRNLSRQLEDGKQPLNGTLDRRVRLYGQQGRPTHYAFAKAEYKRRGFDEERSILNKAEHCNMCISESERGFVPIGDLVPIGMRTCRSNDRCSMQYRNSTTGETETV